MMVAIYGDTISIFDFVIVPPALISHARLTFPPSPPGSPSLPTMPWHTPKSEQSYGTGLKLMLTLLVFTTALNLILPLITPPELASLTGGEHHDDRNYSESTNMHSVPLF